MPLVRLKRTRIAAAAATLGLALATLAATSAFASSHREAPCISGQTQADATDLYMFRSYEAGRRGFVTMLANHQPFQDRQGGPNVYMFNVNALRG